MSQEVKLGLHVNEVLGSTFSCGDYKFQELLKSNFIE